MKTYCSDNEDLIIVIKNNKYTLDLIIFILKLNA